MQMLVSSMSETPNSLIAKMNLRTDSIVVNQCAELSSSLVGLKNGSHVQWFNFPDRGIGRSRNEALLRANADIVLFCDEDCCYFDDVSEIVLSEFQDNQDADFILFDLEPITDLCDGRGLRIRERKQVGKFSFMKYGAVHFAVRLSALRKSNIYFSLLFGGGAQFSCGEDSLFLKCCLDAGMKVITSPSTIGTVRFDNSTWFEGYTDKFFFDKGALYRCMFGHLHWLVSLRTALKVRYKGVSVRYSMSKMLKGARYILVSSPQGYAL